MTPKEILLSSISRKKLRISESNPQLCEGHITKADHNLIVMTDLGKLGHNDWVVTTAYYAMYQSVLALLSRVGLESKEHAATIALLEYLLENPYADYLWKIKGEREKVQYGISINHQESKSIMKLARDFVMKMKLVIGQLDDKIMSKMRMNISELKALASSNQNL